MIQIVESGATHNPEETTLAWDADPSSRWTTREPQTPGMAYWIGLKNPAMISGVRVTTLDETDNPRLWTVAIMASSGGHGYIEVASGEGPIIVAFPPVRGQWVKILQRGNDLTWWWSIHNFEVIGEDIPPVVEPPPEPPVVDEEVGPAVFNEMLARYWAKRWAMKFGWKIGEPCFVTGPGELLVTQSLTYPILRNKGDGVFEPWPFTNLEGG